MFDWVLNTSFHLQQKKQAEKASIDEAVKLTDNKLVITDFILNNEYICEVEEIRKILTKKR